MFKFWFQIIRSEHWDLIMLGYLFNIVLLRFCSDDSVCLYDCLIVMI